MTARDKETDIERTAGYAFSQVSGAIVGGIILCVVISAILTTFFGIEMTIGAAAFTTLFCIPVA